MWTWEISWMDNDGLHELRRVWIDPEDDVVGAVCPGGCDDDCDA